MGSAMGYVSEETPPYRVIGKSEKFPYELRQYEPQLQVETESTENGAAFKALARYIGVLSAPANKPREPTSGEDGQRISMTAPVVMSKKEEDAECKDQQGVPIAMTAPVVMENRTNDTNSSSTMRMAFILPASRFKSLESVPEPTDPNVRVVEIPGRSVAVSQFSGRWQVSNVGPKVEELREWLKQDGIEVTSPSFNLMAYNPPWTPPWWRTNEVSIEIKPPQK